MTVYLKKKGSEMKIARVKGLNIPEDVTVELRTDGEVNFYFHSEKGRIKIEEMSEVERLKFAVAVTAKVARFTKDK
jgi:hypothetical protein